MLVFFIIIASTERSGHSSFMGKFLTCLCSTMAFMVMRQAKKGSKSMKSRVVLLSCDSYDEDKVYEKIKTGLSLLGGADRFIKKDEKILLKLNLVRGAAVERAVTTHPSVAIAVARILSEEGFKDIGAGDSSGFGSSVKIMEELGLKKPFDKYNVKLREFKSGQRVSYPQGIHAKEFVIAQDVLDADAIISLPKLKTHALEHITGAVKNQYGCVFGLNKAKGHTVYPSQESFAKMLIDLDKYVKPRLYIADGITAMEGNGPTSGEPVAMNLILMSDDPVALDSVFCSLIYLPPENVPTNVFGKQMGLGTYLEDEIEIITQDGIVPLKEIVEKYGKPDFDVIRKKHVSKGIMGLVTGLRRFKARPRIDEKLCRKCGICTEVCPVEGKAVKFKNGRSKPPVYDYKKCIRCFCCQEMCPHKAIYVKGKR